MSITFTQKIVSSTVLIKSTAQAFPQVAKRDSFEHKFYLIYSSVNLSLKNQNEINIAICYSEEVIQTGHRLKQVPEH